MEINRYTIPAAISENFTFIMVSDIHNAPIEPILNVIQSEKADAVLVPGDFIHDFDHFEKGFSFLSKSKDMKPTFCSLGNHERKYKGDIASLVVKAGATLLDNTDTVFRGIHIGGLSSGFLQEAEQGNLKETPMPDLAFLKRFAALDGYKILLSHHPEYYKPYIRELDIDLILSGHAHGGQWRFFGQGIFAPGQGFFPKYTSGLYEGRMLVGRGLGDSHKFPPRIFNKPEILIVTLQAK